MLPRLYATFHPNFADFLNNVDEAAKALDGDAVHAPHAAALDIYEREDRFECWLDLPGVAREDVKISLEDETLTIKGERPAQAETRESTKHFRRTERWTGSFSRSLTLPSTVDASRIEAQLKDGVLRVVLPKSERAKPRSIEIKG